MAKQQRMPSTALLITGALLSGAVGFGVVATYFPDQFTARSPVADNRIQCASDVSQTVTLASRAENGAGFTNTRDAGLYRIEVVGGYWANHRGDTKIARFHGTNFSVYKNSGVQFGPDGRPRNTLLHFASLFLDPPYSNSERRVAEAAYGIDQTVQLGRGDRLVFVVDGIKGKFGEYRGDIKLRICPTKSSPTPTPPPRVTPTPTAKPTPRPTNTRKPTPTPTRQLTPGFGWR